MSVVVVVVMIDAVSKLWAKLFVDWVGDDIGVSSKLLLSFRLCRWLLRLEPLSTLLFPNCVAFKLLFIILLFELLPKSGAATVFSILSQSRVEA